MDRGPRCGMLGLLCAFALGSVTAHAQQPNGADRAAIAAALIEKASAQPTPHRDGHADLSGYWVVPGGPVGALQVSGPAQLSADGKSIQLAIAAPQDVRDFETKPVARRRADTAARPSYKPEFVAKATNNFDHANTLDPTVRCMPPGVPRIGAPQEITQSRNVVYLLYALRNYYRVIPTDGRAHDADADAMPMGDSVGRWEGDTLVIDSVNFSDDTWLDNDGSFHTAHMHVVERLSRKGNSLSYQATVEDPEVMTQPWLAPARVVVVGAAGQHVAQDYPCIEKDVDHFVNGNRH